MKDSHFINKLLQLNKQQLGRIAPVIGLVLLMVAPRLLNIGGYIIVDEADRWRWARDFVYALSQGDLAATLVGDGYPGIVPVWAESIWVFIEAIRRSLLEGQWIGQAGLSHLFHEWDRSAFLFQQRLPIVLLNTIIALAIVWLTWQLFGKRVALVSGLLIALDPFYLSDSRVNRAEAIITGLMTISILFLIFYYQKRRFRYVIISGVFGGLSLLTKIQALAIAPAIALSGLLIYFEPGSKKRNYPSFPLSYSLKQFIKFGSVWIAAASLTWFILWPSMWVAPLKTLSLVYNYTTRKVGAEGVSLFFLGQTYHNADPGPLFYPIVFFMRLTPLALLGLIGAVLAGVYYWRLPPAKRKVRLSDLHNPNPDKSEPKKTIASLLKSWPKKQELRGLGPKGSLILVVYVIIYALLMSVGSHKQDRYLMPIFLSLDILAAMGLVYIWNWGKSKIKTWGIGGKKYGIGSQDDKSTPYFLGWPLVALLVIIQMATVLPHHPYYYSYFNPLFGGGKTAVRTLRIGWGEGMDQVGRYLANKPGSHDLVVSSRFTHNMLDFKGELISLVSNGRWTQADYIVLYIQQVQRRLDPSPGFIDYFQARQPEKIITLGGIDYAWIYPLPFTTPANPQLSQIPGQAALLGYCWETNEQIMLQESNGISAKDSPFAPSQIRLFWENLGLADDRQLAARLVSPAAKTEWTACLPDSIFITQAQTPGEFVESLCRPHIFNLPFDTYTVEFGLASTNPLPENGGEKSIEPLLFPEGWYAARLTAAGEVVDTPEVERFKTLVNTALPATAQRLDRIYNGRLRLVAYQINPARPKPGEEIELTLYWQPVREILEPLDLVVQLADSRSISLGRSDILLYTPSREEVEGQWLPGNVATSHHKFKLSSDLEGPLAAQVEIALLNEAEVFLPATNLAGATLDNIVGRFTIAPDIWPTLTEAVPLKAGWQNDITLRGYKLLPEQGRPGEVLEVSLFWETNQPLAGNYVVFVHLLDKAGQLKMQNDSLPRAGAYPTPWWKPGVLVEDVHRLTVPEDLSGGLYQLVVGLYRPEDGVRLPLIDKSDSFVIGTIQIR